MTRQALELLAGQWRAMTCILDSMAANHPEDSVLHGDYKSRAQIYGLCAEQLEFALRAQAEADKGLREALAYYADFDGQHVGMSGQYFVQRQTLDREIFWRPDRGQTARAALAQAGGES